MGLGPLASLSRVWVSPGGVRSHAVCSNTPPPAPTQGPAQRKGSRECLLNECMRVKETSLPYTAAFPT